MIMLVKLYGTQDDGGEGQGPSVCLPSVDRSKLVGPSKGLGFRV